MVRAGGPAYRRWCPPHPDEGAPLRSLLGTPATRFRIAAVAEAVSYAGLLVGMLFKYAISGNDAGVALFGPIHGVIAILYLLAALTAWTAHRWSTSVGLLSLLASLPPFASVVFERWATRTGRLDDRPAGEGRPAEARGG